MTDATQNETEEELNELDSMLQTTREKVSHTISSLDVALATWDGLKKRPSNFEKIMAKFRKLKAKLETWELKSLKTANADPDVKVKNLREFLELSDSFKEVLT